MDNLGRLLRASLFPNIKVQVCCGVTFVNSAGPIPLESRYYLIPGNILSENLQVLRLKKNDNILELPESWFLNSNEDISPNICQRLWW